MQEERINILMVDDRPENLIALEALLESPHVNLVKCLSGEDALKRILKEEFSLILLDVQMPGIDGYETAKLIKSREKYKDIPIIFITAINKEPDHVLSGYAIGAVDYLFKPFDPDVLKAKVDQIVQLYWNGKRMAQQAELLREKTRELEEANNDLLKLTLELRRAEELARMIGETSPDSILIFDAQARIVRVNPAVEDMFGYRMDELEGERVERLFPDQFPSMGELRSRAVRQYETVARGRDDSRFPAELNISEYLLDGEPMYVCTARDITDRVMQMVRLKHMATHDGLTHLPNRLMVSETIQQWLRDGRSFGAILLDLDHFKAINDTLGHELGDILLTQLASAIRSALPAAEKVFRLGGDEFAVLLPDCDRQHGVQTALAILSEIDRPFVLGEAVFPLSASLGLVFCPEHGSDAATLLRRADVAMYTAKRSGSGYAVYREDYDLNNTYRLQLMGDLRSAIEKEELRLAFQPKIDVKRNRLTGVEALLRWEHPKHGWIPPSEFIPMAEQIGVIHVLTSWVLTQAIRQCRAWKEEGLEIGVAVNLSARNLQDVHLADKIGHLLKHYGISPGMITLEITESFIMADPIRARDTLLKIHSMGIQLAIDDFGTGYSSLEYLKRLPVDSIKIDRSFIRDMTRHHTDAMIVRSIVYLAHNLGLFIVAEGVEDKECWELLVECGCDQAQGYFLLKPLFAEEFEKWYRAWSVECR